MYVVVLTPSLPLRKYVLYGWQITNPEWQIDLSQMTCQFWLVANDMSILVSETIRISMLPKAASDKSYILFLIEFMLIWLIMTLFRFFVLNFFNVSLKLSSADLQAVKWWWGSKNTYTQCLEKVNNSPPEILQTLTFILHNFYDWILFLGSIRMTES